MFTYGLSKCVPSGAIEFESVKTTVI